MRTTITLYYAKVSMFYKTRGFHEPSTCQREVFKTEQKPSDHLFLYKPILEKFCTENSITGCDRYYCIGSRLITSGQRSCVNTIRKAWKSVVVVKLLLPIIYHIFI